MSAFAVGMLNVATALLETVQSHARDDLHRQSRPAAQMALADLPDLRDFKLVCTQLEAYY